jgi:hypothetical protein
MLLTHAHNYSIFMWKACVQSLSERIYIHPHEWMFGLVVKTHTSSNESWVWIPPSTTYGILFVLVFCQVHFNFGIPNWLFRISLVCEVHNA